MQKLENFIAVRKSFFSKQKNIPPWWIHIWSGLLRDPTAKHFKAMRGAIWLYLYLLIVADRRNGMLFRKLDTIAAETGINKRSISRWLAVLRNGGYIKTTTSGRSLNIWITKWRPLVRSRGGPKS